LLKLRDHSETAELEQLPREQPWHPNTRRSDRDADKNGYAGERWVFQDHPWGVDNYGYRKKA
jgi:hypothetical protein